MGVVGAEGGLSRFVSGGEVKADGQDEFHMSMAQ